MSVFYFWIGSGEGGREGTKGEGAKRERGEAPSRLLTFRTAITRLWTTSGRRAPSGASGVRQASNRQSEMKTDRIQKAGRMR